MNTHHHLTETAPIRSGDWTWHNSATDTLHLNLAWGKQENTPCLYLSAVNAWDKYDNVNVVPEANPSFPLVVNAHVDKSGKDFAIGKDTLSISFTTNKELMYQTEIVTQYWTQRGDKQKGTARQVTLLAKNPELGFYAGVTVHNTLGTWSSSELHDFELDTLSRPGSVEPYPDFQEFFAYITWPRKSWLVQTTRSNYGCILKDHDIREIQLGPHPVVAAPGTRLAYFWVYVNGAKKNL